MFRKGKHAKEAEFDTAKMDLVRSDMAEIYVATAAASTYSIDGIEMPWEDVAAYETEHELDPNSSAYNYRKAVAIALGQVADAINKAFNTEPELCIHDQFAKDLQDAQEGLVKEAEEAKGNRRAEFWRLWNINPGWSAEDIIKHIELRRAYIEDGFTDDIAANVKINTYDYNGVLIDE